jgi:hypothetical protein
MIGLLRTSAVSTYDTFNSNLRRERGNGKAVRENTFNMVGKRDAITTVKVPRQCPLDYLVRIGWSSSVVQRLACKPLDPRFAGSNPAKDDCLLRAIKIRSMPSFGWEVKPSVPCHKILQQVKEPYEYERDTS